MNFTIHHKSMHIFVHRILQKNMNGHWSLSYNGDVFLFLSKFVTCFLDEVLHITMHHCTQMRFACFFSGGFTNKAVINPSERKLAKRISVHCAMQCQNCPYSSQDFFPTAKVKVVQVVELEIKRRSVFAQPFHQNSRLLTSLGARPGFCLRARRRARARCHARSRQNRVLH